MKRRILTLLLAAALCAGLAAPALADGEAPTEPVTTSTDETTAEPTEAEPVEGEPAVAPTDETPVEASTEGEPTEPEGEPVAISMDSAPHFEDVPADSWFAEPVAWAVEIGVVNGTSPTTFSSYDFCTRAQIVTLLWRAAGNPTPTSDATFDDVPADAWYARAVAWAAENGMADGETFDPEAPCTREMAVEFMWRAAGSPTAEPAAFEDISSPAVDWAVSVGVTNGTSATTFSPDELCNRAHIATFLYRAFAK